MAKTIRCGVGQGVWLACMVVGLLGMSAELASEQTLIHFAPPGPNVALGKPYTLDPQANYAHCTDPGDREQLTDGISVRGSTGNFWVQTACVGWYSPGVANITVDLGEVSPIAGLSFSTAAGAADVGWPTAILILVSDEGRDFHYVGELCSLSAKFGIPKPFGLQEHRFCTDDLKVHGRFVRLGVVAGGPYLFCDEVEVYGGPKEMLEIPLGGMVVTDLKAFLAEHRTGIALQSRIALDIALTQQRVAAAPLGADVRVELNREIRAVQEANEAIPHEPGADYRAIYPLNGHHARLFGAMARLRRAEGFPRLFLWHNDRWERLGMWDAPPQAPHRAPTLSVRLMANETRAETLNIANLTAEPLTVTVSFSGLPGGRTPAYITVQSAEYVIMQGGTWDANALPIAPREQNGWRVVLPPGVSRQLWLSFHPQESPIPGRYSGRVVVQVEGSGQTLTSPVSLTIEPIRFPDQTTLALGMWDYAHNGGAYDLNQGNLPAALTHMQSHPYNAPWGMSHLFPQPGPDHFDAAGRLIKPLDLSAFDAWVATWPQARYYLVYAAVGTTFAGAKMGADEFNQRLGSAMRAWTDHARKIGLDPRRIGILLVDEPTEDEQDRQILTWAKAIKAAAPELRIFEDPHRTNPRNHLREMLEICDILCPGRGSYEPGGPIAQFFDELREGGRELWLYSVSYPAIASATSFRVHGWHCWIAKATGTGYWSYGDAGGSGNSWNQLGAKSTVFSPVYIDSNSVTDGKHWLAIIEGIQDYEYLRLLRDRVNQRVGAGKRSRALNQAREVLNTVPGEVYAGRMSCEQGRLRVLAALLSLK